MFTGCGTAMVTPFRADGSLDEVTLRKLVRRQIEEGIDFLVPCGTTGESPAITMEEHLRIVSITVEESNNAARKVPVLAGAGGYFTREVVELGQECQRAGADGVLSVTPYYNKPSQEGLYQHYKALAESIRIPIIVYNVQGRTGVNVETSTLVRLAEIPNIVGVKEASGNISQIAEVAHSVPEDFTILSGDDAITIGVIALGGRGLISVASNEIPHAMAQLVHHANDGDFAGARAIQRQYMPLMQANFLESNPIPVKWAMGRMGLLDPVYRLPLVPPSEPNQKKIEQVLESLQLIQEEAIVASRH
jgi:4-hydroxy-tetrahydrodipicolinate synthase